MEEEIKEVESETPDFDGVFRFTNNSDEEFVVLWNNKEYTFPAKSRSPIIIPDEPLENIQSIRKKFAYKWAEREWYKGSEYKKLSKMGRGLPPTRDDKSLEPLIQMCLAPLPIKEAKVKKLSGEKRQYRGSKAVGKNANLNAEFADDTKDENLIKLGEQSNEE